MQHPCTLKLQTPSIRQRSDSIRYLPLTNHPPLRFGNICTWFTQNTSQIFELWHLLQSCTIRKDLILLSFPPSKTISFLLSTLTFKPLLLLTSTIRQPHPPLSSGRLPIHQTYKRPGNLHSLPSFRGLTPITLIPILISLIIAETRGYDTNFSHITINLETLALTLFYFYTLNYEHTYSNSIKVLEFPY